MKSQQLSMQGYAWTILFLFIIGCNKQREEPPNRIKEQEPIIKTEDDPPTGHEVFRTISVLNPGFEQNKTNWGDPDLFAISTSDFHSGTKSAKLESSGDKIEQTITVGSGSDSTVTLKAWILGRGTLGARNGATVLGSVSGNYSSWTQVTVTFNAGSLGSIVIYGAYNGGTGRFDDFTLNKDGSGAPTLPAAPSGLSAAANGININLSWTDNSNNETGFKLERKTGAGGTYSEIAGNIAANSTSYSDNNLTAGTTYFYRIRSFNGAGNSSYSNETSATTVSAPAAPSGLGATANGTSAINVSWTDNSNNETGFKLERKTGAGGTYSEIAGNIAANSTSFSNTGLSAGTTYFYRIRSFNGAGNSSYSAETSATTSSGGGSVPASILNLANWKITLPVDGPDGGSNADEITQPALATYSIDPYFKNNSDNTGVIFRAHTGGATTSGSGYPRSELREMTNNGASNASWSSGSGTHTMEIDQAITHLPVVKPHIVAGQIHDSDDDVIVFRLEGTKLFIDINGDDGPTLTNNYVLGTRFKVKFVVSGNQTRCYYNDVLIYTHNQSYSGAYFKAGAYTQSSCTGTPGSSESCSAYGEVIIYNVTVTHQ